MGTLILVRHGQASLFSKGEHGLSLSADYDRLSEQGERQAQLLGEEWASRGLVFDRAIVGPRKRQEDTGQIVARAFAAAGRAFPALEPMPCFDEMHAEALIRTQLPSLMETHEAVRAAVHALGDAAGTSDAFKRFQRVFDRVMSLWLAGSIEAPGIESFTEFCARVDGGIGQLCAPAAGKGARIVVFTSAGTISAALKGALELPGQKVLDLAGVVKNASVSELVFSGSRITPTLFNSVSHLPEHLWTHR